MIKTVKICSNDGNDDEIDYICEIDRIYKMGRNYEIGGIHENVWE